jgi:hypothetical protein
MIARISNLSFFRESVVVGVYIQIRQDESSLCQCVVLEKKKGSLHIIGKEESPLSKLAEVISIKIPLCLIIDGKGVLQRECNSAQDDQELILQAFPNVNPSEYYVQATEQLDTINYACFARKDIIDDIFANLIAQGFSIINVSLGALSFANVVPIKESGRVTAFPYEINLSNGSILGIKRIKEAKTALSLIGEESIPAEKVLALSAAFGYFSTGALREMQSDVVRGALMNYSYLKIIKKGGFALAIFLFLLLLVNFLIFSSQRDKQQQLFAELGQYETTAKQLETYKKEITEKEKLIGSSGIGENTYFSYYADRIAASKPGGIVLQKMQIYPVILKNKKFDIEGLKKDTVFITGTTRNSVLLNDWVKQLQLQKFVSHVSITNYTQLEPGSGTFAITVALDQKKK